MVSFFSRSDTFLLWQYSHTNKLVKFYSGVDGLKTGFTSDAGYCLTSTAKKDNMRLITVVMNEETAAKRSSDTTQMLDYGFNTYTVKTIIDTKKAIGKVDVFLGNEKNIDITSSEEVTILKKKTEEDRNIIYKVNVQTLTAPIKKGDKVGTIDILEDGKIISTIPATVAKDVNKANIFKIFIRTAANIIRGDLKF